VGARSTFGIPVIQGWVSQQEFKQEGFDCIVLMDVLEDLYDSTLELLECLRLLDSDGLLVIQTRQFPGGHYYYLVENGSPFLKMLLPVEHFYLFSEKSIRRLLHDLGIGIVSFESARFPYNMFLFFLSAATRCTKPRSRPQLPPGV
jgi:2-polyprenyl-3-methyl-5-hydroxy-6-metoxy-1,4-benzoquinol methylase